jgi:hypothetical protein
MPLSKRKSEKAVEKNTQTEIEVGKPPKQAYAIAKSEQRKAKKGKK